MSDDVDVQEIEAKPDHILSLVVQVNLRVVSRRPARRIRPTDDQGNDDQRLTQRDLQPYKQPLVIHEALWFYRCLHDESSRTTSFRLECHQVIVKLIFIEPTNWRFNLHKRVLTFAELDGKVFGV